LFGLALAFILRLLHFPRETTTALEFVAMAAAFALGLFWPRLMGQSWAQWRAAFGLHLGRGIFREIGSGILGYIAGMPVMAVGLIITATLLRLSGTTATHPITEVLTRGWGWIALAF